MKFKTGIEFGQKYRDKNSGFEGTANALYFFEFGCTRVNLIALKDAEIKEAVFDEQSLIEVNTEKRVEAFARAGGDRPGPTSTTGTR